MDRPLRILTALHSFEPGGVERVALRLVTAWHEQGIDTPLLMGREDGAMRSEWPGLAYRSLAVDGLETGWFETLWMIWHLPRQIRLIAPDVLFCAGNSYAVVAVAMKLRLGRACPPVMAKVSNDLARKDMPWPVQRAYRLWLRIQGRFIDRFVGMADPMREEIAKAMGVDSRRITIINDPAMASRDIDCASADRADWPLSPGGTRFVAAGRLCAQKNFSLLLMAFARIAQRDDRLTIYGEGPERRKLLALAARLGIADRIDMPGHVDGMIAALSRHHLFVLSSDYEGVPAVVIEALAAGVQIVATDCSVSMAALLAEGELGTLVPVGSAEALATAMDAARSRPQDRTAAQAQARRFTVEAAAMAYVDCAAAMTQAVACRSKNCGDPVRPGPARNVPLPISTAVSGMHETIGINH